jgi:ubiquinone/menaquinone biosynthesis C-methylase UbiE
MSTSSGPLDEHTYFIDAENAAEMARLTNLGHLITRNMDGLFPKTIDLFQVQRILDIACGPGRWVLDVAQTYPDKKVTGIDISRLMIEYAKAQAREKGLNNVQFQVMDALKPLEFPDNSFDLVNARFISGFMSKAVWPKVIQEAMRVTRPGGVIRLTDIESAITNSPSAEKLFELGSRALYLSGQSFSVDGRNVGITPMLGRLLRDAGCINIQKAAYAIDFSFGMEEYTSEYQDLRTFLKLIQPFLVKVGVTTQEEVNALYNRAMAEMQSPDFCGIWPFLSVWGTKPE